MSRQIGVSIRQLLYDGGTAREQTEAAVDGELAQELVERSMLESRVVDLCEVYFEVLRSREQVREAQAHVNRHKDMRDMIKARAAADGNRADLALVDGRLSLAVNAMDGQQLALENSLIRFVRLTGQPASRLERPEVPGVPPRQGDLDLTRNWDFLAAQAVLEAAVHKFESTKGNRRPKVYLDAGGSVGEDVQGIKGQDNEARAMITMSWDLYNGGSNKALTKREHWQVRKAQELLRAASEEANYRASLLWKEREGSKSSVNSLGDYVRRLEGVLADYQEQFKVGRQELLNILDVQGELHGARNKWIDAQYNVNTSAYRIWGVQGRLTATIIGDEDVQAYFDRNPDREEVPQNLRPVGALVSSASPRATTQIADVSREDFVRAQQDGRISPSTSASWPREGPAPPKLKSKRKFRLNPFAK